MDFTEAFPELCKLADLEVNPTTPQPGLKTARLLPSEGTMES